DFFHWLDGTSEKDQVLVLGAGEAKLAEELLTGAFARPASDRARALANRPEAQKPFFVSVDLGEEARRLQHPKHRLEQGLYGAMPSAQTSQGRLFSGAIDMLGVLTYTSTLSEDLQKTLDLLEVGGRIWIGTTDAVAIYRDDRLLMMHEYLAAIPGLKVHQAP